MGAGSSSVRVRSLLGAMVASAMLVLMAPSLAAAANTAKFSAASPKSGSYSMKTAPKLSVTAYDKYGAKRTGITMTVDGKKVGYVCSYVVSSSWNPKKPDYRRFKLTYQVPASLSVGTHTVVVRISDLRRKVSTYTWKFYVDSITIPATFSALTPEDGSSSLANLPKISATVAERWDVRGTGSYSMTIDGSAVRSSITYTTAGKYRHFKVWCQCVSALSVGSHSVTVNVRDAAGRTTSQTWSFTVRALPPVYPEMPVEGAGCADCHTGFPAVHPYDDCATCHSPDSPPRSAHSIYPGGPMTEYGPGDVSAHDLGCALEVPCHGGGGAFPHTIGTDCTSCHNPTYPDIPQAHAIDAAAIRALHVSAPTFCTADFCHSGSLTAEHYRHTDEGGATLDCATCHASSDPLVAGAIASGDTSCTTCHELLDAHPDTTIAHAAVGTCVRSGCHAPSVTTVHKNNCVACHALGTVPSTNCGSCHATSTYHAGMDVAHALSTGGCVAYDCHGVGVGMDAALTHKNNCTRCHNAVDTPSLDCVGCHTESAVDLHPNATGDHTPPAIFCTTSNCHGTDVAATHAGSERGCTVCHAEGVAESTNCTDCHDSDLISVHGDAVASHRITGNSCVAAGCHSGTDAAALHTAEGGPGCIACHDVGQSPTLECAPCHPGGLTVIHEDAAGNHTSTTSTCIVAGCHLTDVSTVHYKDGVADCVACHRDGQTLSANCTQCHTQGIVETHDSADAEHATPAGFCETTCHADNVATIHEGNTSCIACHNPDGNNPSVFCGDCHEDAPNALHPWAVAGHVSSNLACQLPGCHATDLVDVHDGMEGDGCFACHSTQSRPAKVPCGDCHPGDISTLHDDADASHAVPDGYTCDSAPQCHASNVATIHARSTSDCAACHAEGKVASTTCSNCHHGTDEQIHSSGDSAHASPSSGCVSLHCHGTDVSVPHNAEGGPSCLACHATDVTPGLNCNANGCHPGDLTTRHADLAGTAHDAASGSCVADGCHGTTAGGVNVATLHRGGPGCVACHADGETASTNCADCHSTDLAVVHTRGSAYHTAPPGSCDLGGAGSCHIRDVIALHTVTGGPGCAACHAPGVDTTSRCTDCHTGQFWGVIHPVGTKHTPPDGSCVTSDCHNIDVATIHSLNPPTLGPGCNPCHRTGSLTVDCTECHTVNMTPRHALQDALHAAEGNMCVNDACHGSDDGVNVATLHWQAPNGCASCHADDADPSTSCTDCHAEDAITFHDVGTKHDALAGTCVADGCHGTTAGGADVVALHSAGPSCAACHGPGKTPSRTCAAVGCHDAVPATEHAKYVGAGVGGAHRAQASCNNAGCHTNVDVTVIHGTVGCTCHAPGKTLTLDCATGGCHPEGFPAVHNPGLSDHAQSNNSCSSTQCHYQSVDTIHSAPGGPKCAACHTVPAGPAPTARCTACHVGALAPSPASDPSHPTSTTPDTMHTVPATGCTQASCHSTNITSIHAVPTTNHPAPPRCMACHGSGVVTSKVCADCHFSDFTSEHPAPPAKHTAVTGNCVKSGCHATDVVAIHREGDDPPECGACHGNPQHAPSLDCTICHFSNFTSEHPVPPIPHTSADGCTPQCHNPNVATIHTTPTPNHPNPPGCFACHDGVGVISTVCADCHSSGTYHTDAAALHYVTNACTTGGCHPTDASTIHGRTSCSACHSTGNPNGGPSTNCSVCHAGVSLAQHKSIHGYCNSCHSGTYHGSPNPVEDSYSCATCHPSPGSPSAFQSGGYDHGCGDADNGYGCH